MEYWYPDFCVCYENKNYKLYFLWFQVNYYGKASMSLLAGQLIRVVFIDYWSDLLIFFCDDYQRLTFCVFINVEHQFNM